MSTTVVPDNTKLTMISAVSGADLKVVLLNQNLPTDIPTLKGLGSWVSLSAYEASGTSYVAGGVALSGVSAFNSNNAAYFNGNSVIWPSSTITAYGAAVYRTTNKLVIYISQFSVPYQSIAGDFTLSWSSNDILQMVG